jgi:hypothetical protein
MVILGLVMKEEGFGSLYKLFLPKVLRLGPGGGILLVISKGIIDFSARIDATNSHRHSISLSIGVKQC